MGKEIASQISPKYLSNVSIFIYYKTQIGSISSSTKILVYKYTKVASQTCSPANHHLLSNSTASHKIFLQFFSFSKFFMFTESEAKLNCYQQKLNIRVVTRFAEQHRTQDLKKLGHSRKISKLGTKKH